jgi:hypothetical protein
MMRRMPCRPGPLVLLLATALAAGLAGCKGGDGGTAAPSTYTITRYATLTTSGGATVIARIDYRRPDGTTFSLDPATLPWQVTETGYASGDSVQLRVRGTVTASGGGSATLRLSIWGTEPSGAPADFGTDRFVLSAGAFDRSKLAILP